MLNRHETRERIVFALYQHLLLNKDIDSCFEDNFSEEENSEFIDDIRIDLSVNENKYIEEISQYLKNWTFDRLNLVEQAILLETVSELKNHMNEKAVIIDEAVILAKTYGDDDSYKYINGVLDHLCSKSQ